MKIYAGLKTGAVPTCDCPNRARHRGKCRGDVSGVAPPVSTGVPVSQARPMKGSSKDSDSLGLFASFALSMPDIWSFDTAEDAVLHGQTGNATLAL